MSQQIKLGAPTTITGGASPQTNLTVQVMSSCKELTLHDESSRCSAQGAIALAANLLRQRLNEDSITSSTWQGMTAVYGDNLPSVISQGGDLQLSVVDAAGIPQQAAWSVEVIEAESGATAAITQSGLLSLSGRRITGRAKAINWNDSTQQVCFWFGVVDGLSEAIAGREKEYMDALAEYPALVNSLVDTGIRSFIRQVTDGNSGFIPTGIVCSADMSFEAVVRSKIITGGTNYIFGGGGSTLANCMYLYHNISDSNKRAYFRYSGTENNQTNALWNDGWHTHFYDISKYGVDEQSWSRTANVSSFVEKPSSPVCIFGAMRNDNGTSYSRNTVAGNTIDIEKLYIRNGADEHIFVPFIRKGEAGMIDLFGFTWHGNGQAAGSFEVINESR